VTERAQYIGRIRNLSRQVAQAYLDSREALGFPMCDPQDLPQGLNKALLAQAGTQEGAS